MINIIIIYIILILLIIYLIIIYFYIFSNKNENENFKIIQYIPESINYFNLVSNLNNQFGIVNIYNFNNLNFNNKKNIKNVIKNKKIINTKINDSEDLYEYKNDDVKHLIKKNENIFKKKKNSYLLFGNYKYNIDELPYISTNQELFLGGYHTCISPQGDCVLLYKFSKSYNNNNIIWLNKNNAYLNSKSIDNTFLYENNMEEILKHNSYIILTKYLYDSKPALHVNYYTRREGHERNIVFETFIGFLNFIKQYLHDNKIFYYSIAGSTNLNSAKWQLAINLVFKNDVYYSPGIEKKFITNTTNPNFYFTPDFICVCKNLAPYGIYFYVSEPMFNYTPNKILVCEILKKNEKKKKSKNDNTQLIYNNAIYEKEYININLKIDNLEKSEIDLKKIDINKINKYYKIEKKVKTLHYYEN